MISDKIQWNKMLEFHGLSKNLDPNIQPEKQNSRPLKGNEISHEMPRMGQGKYCIPEHIIVDQDSAFMSSLMNYLFKKFDIKIKTVAPYNHEAL